MFGSWVEGSIATEGYHPPEPVWNTGSGVAHTLVSVEEVKNSVSLVLSRTAIAQGASRAEKPCYARPVSHPKPSIRSAAPADVPLIASLIRELARYERLEDQAVLEERALRRHLFGKRPYAEVLLSCEQKTATGFALFFHTFSTFLAKPSLYLEDLFVRPEHRGKGHGRALMVKLAQLVVRRGCGRFEWAVLDWNAPSIAFYRSIGAIPMDDWTVFRLTGSRLEALAKYRR
jgi:GNAT superfamily N-acetyltransferase